MCLVSRDTSSLLSLFHRDSFLFFYGATDTIVDREATKLAIAWVKAFAQVQAQAD